jgi:phage terminase small subunit
VSKRPAGASPLTDKQARFVSEYLVDLNATQAAIRAGYSEKTATAIGCENLRKPDIAAAIAEQKAQQLGTAGLSAVRILEELRRLATVDVRSFFQPDGSLKPMNEWTPEQGAAVSSMEVIIKNAEAGDGITDRIHKFKLWDKPRSLEMLAKHFALLTEQMQVKGALRIIHELPE